MDSVVKLSTKQLDLFVESGKPASTSLTVENISKTCICFKVKTTQPQRYSVRPSVGVIKPGEKKDILITLEPLKEIPEDLKSNKDRFLLQVARISTDAATTDVHELWKRVKEDSVLQQKFRVQFVLGGQNADIGSSSNAYSSQASLLPSTEGSSEKSPRYVDSHSEKFDTTNGTLKRSDIERDKPKLSTEAVNDSSGSMKERMNLATVSSPRRVLERNHSLISVEERYQLALERIHVLNRELALRELELEKLKESRYGKEDLRNSGSSSSYEGNDSVETPATRDGQCQESEYSHKRSSKNISSGWVGNIGFSVIQVFLIVLISFFFGKVCNVSEKYVGSKLNDVR